MTVRRIVYIKQDDSYVGCSEPGCCGESYEAVEETFHDCDCEGVDVSESHLRNCLGGGPIMEWRPAKRKELIAYESGVDAGFSEGWTAGNDYFRKKFVGVLESRINKCNVDPETCDSCAENQDLIDEIKAKDLL